MPVFYHSSWDGTFNGDWDGLILFIIGAMWLVYIIDIFIERGVDKEMCSMSWTTNPDYPFANRKYFLINLFVPFRYWIISFINLFKN